MGGAPWFAMVGVITFSRPASTVTIIGLSLGGLRGAFPRVGEQVAPRAFDGPVALINALTLTSLAIVRFAGVHVAWCEGIRSPFHASVIASTHVVVPRIAFLAFLDLSPA